MKVPEIFSHGCIAVVSPFCVDNEGTPLKILKRYDLSLASYFDQYVVWKHDSFYDIILNNVKIRIKEVVRPKELKFYSLYALTYLSLFTTGYLVVISFLYEKIGCQPLTSFREDFPIVYTAILLIVSAVTFLGYFLHNNKYLDIISRFGKNPTCKKRAIMSWIGYMVVLIVIGMPILYIISPN